VAVYWWEASPYYNNSNNFTNVNNNGNANNNNATNEFGFAPDFGQPQTTRQRMPSGCTAKGENFL
jgi:hypothetical protein